MSNYAILHAHSEFSVRDSLLRVGELPVLAKERGWNAVALTDHGGIEGLYHFKKAAKDVGIKPILGCEFYVKCSDDDKKTKAHHLTVLSKSAKGFSSLTKALSIAHKYHYRPSKHRAEVPMETILDMEDVIILSGCFSSPFWRPSDRAPEEIAQFVDRFRDDFYFEIQAHHDWQPQLELNKTIIEMADAFGRPVVVTPDCHIGSPSDAHFHDALLSIQSGFPMGHEKAWRFETHQTYVQTPKELHESLVKCGVPAHLVIGSLEETGKIADKVKNWVWEEIPPPRLPDVGGDLVEIAKKGLEDRGLSGRLEYEERLQTELDAFTKAGLAKYLLLVRHCVNLFKYEGAEIGPRGSVGGSLVAFTLGLANLDPITHGLSWQRFWAPGRVGMPDVDIDVDADFRARVGEVLRKEFGEDNVAQISNFSKFGLRMAIRDAARAYGIRLPDYPPDAAEKDAKDVIDIPMGLDLKKRAGDEPVEFARMLFNRIRQFGTHAGGFVIADKPLTDGGLAAVVCRRDIGGGRSICWDMKVAEKLGFIKFDFLGIDSLSAIKEIGKQIQIDWMKVPLDDAEVIRDICEGRTAGVPQFLTPGLRTFTEMLQPTCFEELVWANAAFRPGGLGQMSPAELAATYREDPNAIMVYQEEIMASCVELAGFTWTEADAVRKVVAKKEGKAEWTKLADKFADGCVRLGKLPRDVALDFWKNLEEFARYAFNRCLAPHETVLMYNGDIKEIGHLKPDDLIYGPDGYPRIVKAIWRVRNRSWRITLDDGSRITCSPDHRFAGDRGVESAESIIRRGGRIGCTPGTTEEDRRMALWCMRHGPVDSGREDAAYTFLLEVSEMASVGAPTDDVCGLGRSGKARELFARVPCAETRKSRSKTDRGMEAKDGRMEGGSSREDERDHREGTGRPLEEGRGIQFKTGRRDGDAFPGCPSEEMGSGALERTGIRDRFGDLKMSVGRSGRDASLPANFWRESVREDDPAGSDARRTCAADGHRLPRQGRSGLLHDLRQASSSIRGACVGEDQAGDAGRLVLRRVVEVEDLGYDDLVDIEVDRDHLFVLASGIVSHNSHAAAYSWHGYRVAWAKRHYPKETFCALLNAKETNAEALMDEATLYGVKILPAHANSSEAERWMNETDGIRPPLTAIDAIDLRVAKSILLRRRDGPFKNIDDFIRRMGKIKYPPNIIPLLFDGVMVDAGFTLPLDAKPAAKISKEFIQEIRGCDKCALRASCRAPVPPEIGKTNVLIVGEAPGYEENKRGRPFVGRSGELIFGFLYENGVERGDVSITNATHCFPCSRDENGRTHALKDGDPSKAEGETVCDWVHKEIDRLKPPLILAVGRKAWQKLGQKTPITKSNGKVITLPNGSKVVASIHPAHVLRDPRVRPELERALRKFAKLYHVLVGKKTEMQV